MTDDLYLKRAQKYRDAATKSLHTLQKYLSEKAGTNSGRKQNIVADNVQRWLEMTCPYIEQNEDGDIAIFIPRTAFKISRAGNKTNVYKAQTARAFIVKSDKSLAIRRYNFSKKRRA